MPPKDYMDYTSVCMFTAPGNVIVCMFTAPGNVLICTLARNITAATDEGTYSKGSRQEHARAYRVCDLMCMLSLAYRLPVW